MVVEKQLRHDVVSPRINLRLQKIHFLEPVGRGRMTFRKSSHPDAKPAGIRMHSPLLGKLTDEPHEVRRMLESIIRLPVILQIARRITAQGQNVPDPSPGIALQNIMHFRFLMADARQMRNRIERGRRLEAHHQIMRHLPRRSTRPIRHTDKSRIIRLQLSNRLKQFPGRLRCLGREKLKRETRSLRSEDVSNMHGEL